MAEHELVFGVEPDETTKAAARKAGTEDGQNVIPKMQFVPEYLAMIRSAYETAIAKQAEETRSSFMRVHARVQASLGNPHAHARIRHSIAHLLKDIDEFDAWKATAGRARETLEGIYLDEAADAWRHRGFAFSIPAYQPIGVDEIADLRDRLDEVRRALQDQ